MPKSKRYTRNPLFVFGPPAFLLIIGLILLFVSLPSSANMPALTNRLNVFQTEFDRSQHSIESANSIWVVVNKQRPLDPAQYTPKKLSRLPSTGTLNNQKGVRLVPEAAFAIRELAKQLNAAGAGKLKLNSGFRSYSYQQQLFKAKVAQYGTRGALLRSAKAGFSEHQTGLAVDVSVPAQGCEIKKCFGETKAGIWIAENAWRFGFILRYELNQTPITGYTYEPWHLRFVGTELASEYKAKGFKTLEEFFELPSARYYLEEITESTND